MHLAIALWLTFGRFVMTVTSRTLELACFPRKGLPLGSGRGATPVAWARESLGLGGAG